MRGFIGLFLAGLLAFTTAHASFEEGLAAYQRGDYKAALSTWRAEAKQGHAVAQFNLGVMYDNGEGVPRDAAEAVRWYRKAAEQGHATAQFYLGVMYADGSGVSQDAAEAVRWYRKAAEQGHADAQYNLGVMYADGSGVDRNYAWAVYWYALAAQQGDLHAPGNLERDLPQLTQMRVTASVANVHSSRSTDSDILRQVRQGDRVWQLDTGDGWYEVYLRDGHTIGWIAASLVEPVTAAPAVSSGSLPPAPASRRGSDSTH